MIKRKSIAYYKAKNKGKLNTSIEFKKALELKHLNRLKTSIK